MLLCLEINPTDIEKECKFIEIFEFSLLSSHNAKCFIASVKEHICYFMCLHVTLSPTKECNIKTPFPISNIFVDSVTTDVVRAATMVVSVLP